MLLSLLIYTLVLLACYGYYELCMYVNTIDLVTSPTFSSTSTMCYRDEAPMSSIPGLSQNRMTFCMYNNEKTYITCYYCIKLWTVEKIVLEAMKSQSLMYQFENKSMKLMT